MKLIEIDYLHTVYHRTPTHGGQDSEFSHKTVEKATMRLVVADDSEFNINAARAYCDDGANRYDKNYVRLGTRVVGSIYAILQPALTRL